MTVSPAVVVWVSDTAVAALPSEVERQRQATAAARQCSVGTGSDAQGKRAVVVGTTKLPLVVALTDGVVVLAPETVNGTATPAA